MQFFILSKINIRYWSGWFTDLKALWKDYTARILKCLLKMLPGFGSRPNPKLLVS